MNFSMLLFFFIILILLILSIKERIGWQYMREKNWDTIGTAKASPLSQAITGTVGTAGGIYLSLIILKTFLELDMPDLVYVGSLAMEPLASLSVTLAIIQPFAMRIWNRH